MKFIDLLLPFIMMLLEKLLAKRSESGGDGMHAPKKFSKAEVKAAMEELVNKS